MRRLDLVKMSVLPKLIHVFNKVPIGMLAILFGRYRQDYSKSYRERQKN